MDFFRTAYFRTAFAACLATGLFACAKVGSLNGGPKDTTAPKLDTLASTRNYATHFAERQIELRFDEWVALSDISTQVVISPPLAVRPDIVLKEKTVRIKFDEKEIFRPNTTYTINFGNAVKDFRENNPAKDLRFVFSTGDFIDSLRVGGFVADAFSGEAVENIAVMLYDILEDSVVKKERPYYFAKTEKSGQFSIQNVRPGVFKMVAIEDANQNLKWDEGERIAFPEKNIQLPDSLHSKQQRLLLSKELPAFRSLDINTNRYGIAKITYNSLPFKDLRPQTETPGVRLLPDFSGDSLLVWYDFAAAAPTENWSFWVGKDTAKIKALSRAEFLKNKKLTFAGELAAAPGGPRRAKQATAAPPTNPVKTIALAPSKPLSLDFNFPVSRADTSRWLLVEDSSKTSVRDFSVAPDSLSPRRLDFTTRWQSGKNYSLTLLPGAATDFFGGTNTDTLRRKINILSEKTLGGLNLISKNLKPGNRYILHLLNGQIVEAERIFEAAGAEQKFAFQHLPTAVFTVRLIEDQNGNGRWDPSGYFEHRQPEAVFTQKLEALRANWEVEATVEMGVILNRTKK